MPESDRDVPTEVRLTFRTWKSFEEKLNRIAVARNLNMGKRPSVGAALNYLIENYDDSAEKKMLAAHRGKGKNHGRR